MYQKYRPHPPSLNSRCCPCPSAMARSDCRCFLISFFSASRTFFASAAAALAASSSAALCVRGGVTEVSGKALLCTRLAEVQRAVVSNYDLRHTKFTCLHLSILIPPAAERTVIAYFFAASSACRCCSSSTSRCRSAAFSCFLRSLQHEQGAQIQAK
jgi:hypothetical protein